MHQIHSYSTKIIGLWKVLDAHVYHSAYLLELSLAQ